MQHRANRAPAGTTRLVGLLVFCLLSSGCVLYTRDVTKAGYPTDYQPGTTYRLQQDAMLLERPSRGWFEEWQLDLPLYRLSFLLHSNQLGSDRVVDVLPAGTIVCYDRLVYWYYFENAELLPVGRIVSGNHAGKDVNLRSISAEVIDDKRMSHWIRLAPAWLVRVEQ